MKNTSTSSANRVNPINSINSVNLINLLLLPLVLLSGACASAATNDLTATLQNGLFEEEANHNLNAAIAAYQSVITRFDESRKLAATAIFRLGECERKQGNTNAANAQYERILREFSDQDQLAALSRSYLAASGKPGQGTTFSERLAAVVHRAGDQAGGSSPPTSEEAADVERIRAMIKDSPDLINAPGREEGQLTPLARAASKGQLVVAQFLLGNGADPQRISQGWTPLQFAAGSGHKSMIELLLAKGADINGKGKEGKTALHEAARNGFNSVVEVLLAHAANVNARDEKGSTPLHEAVFGKQIETVKLLLANKADPNIKDSSDRPPLYFALDKGSKDMAEALIAKGADVNVTDNRGETMLQLAVRQKSYDLVELLLDHGAEVDARKSPNQSTALTTAISYGDKPLTETLLKHKADPNTRFDAPIPEALPSRIPRGTFDPGGQPSGEGYTPLLFATYKGYPDLVELLFDYKADPNLKSAAGRAPLMNAALYADPDKRLRMVKLLLDHGAEVDSHRERDGDTPLLLACSTGETNLAAILLAHKADPNLTNYHSFWPLRELVSLVINNYDRSEIAEMLLKAGADPNQRDKNGRTVMDDLDRAPQPAAIKLAALLRQHGAVEDLPRLDRIEVRRPSSGYGVSIFQNDTNDWNQFTLLELIAVQYKFLGGAPNGSDKRERVDARVLGANNPLSFPRLDRLTLRRAASANTWESSTFDLIQVLESGDCSRDLPLKWGDVIEVPESDHPINDMWNGFSETELQTFRKCLKRQVAVVIKNVRTLITLAPDITGGPGQTTQVVYGAPFWIKPVLLHSDLLLSSSDLSRVKVKRYDAKWAQEREWTLDCANGAPAFWLRNGDTIEVPDKE